MKTYVEIENCAEKFATISDAVEEAERRRLETCGIWVFNAETGEILETQEASRNSNSGDLVYSTWGVFYANLDDNGEIAWSDILKDEINSEAEAEEIAQQIGDGNVYIQAYTQTLSENIENIGEPKFVNAKEG